MGIEYEEVRVVVKNKRDGKKYTLSHQIGHDYDKPVTWKTEDFEIVKGVHVVHG